MNRAFGFLLSVPLLFVAIFLLLVIHNVKQEEMQFEEYVLKFAIDYSTDAAVERCLICRTFGQDYTDQGRTNSDPQVALDTFLNLMCMNYDLPLTEKAKLQIESGVHAGVLCGCLQWLLHVHTYKRFGGRMVPSGNTEDPVRLCSWR